MSIYNCHKQQPQPWMSYIASNKPCYDGGCCPVLVTDTIHLLPFQIISNGAFEKIEYSPYGEDTWTEIVIPYTEVVIEGFYYISYNGSAIDELSCGAYDFKLTAGEVWYFETITIQDFTITENAYTLRDELMLPFKFSEQQFETLPLISQCDEYLPFMFSTENATSETVTVYLYDVVNDCAVEELDIDVTVLTISGRTYYIFEGACIYPFLECGLYKFEIIDGDYSYFSVPFSAECGISDIPDGYRPMLDFNRCVMRDEEGNILTEECSDLPMVLLNRSGTPCRVYSYNVALKTTVLLDIDNIVNSSSDIAHTDNKLWLYANLVVAPFTKRLAEWDVTLVPFTETFNRYITGVNDNPGLCAINDTILISIEWTIVAGNWISKVYESNITADISVNTYKFDLLQDRTINGDYIITTTNKLIVTTLDKTQTILNITQYDYLTGNLEVDIQLSPTIFRPYGLFEYNNEIYIVDFRSSVLTYIWKIDKEPPYTLTLYDTLLFGINGASELLSKLTTHFST